jgi:hypothetical protein
VPAAMQCMCHRPVLTRKWLRRTDWQSVLLTRWQFFHFRLCPGKGINAATQRVLKRLID